MKKLFLTLAVATVFALFFIVNEGSSVVKAQTEPQAEAPRAEEKKDESAGTRKKETRKEKRSRSPSPSAEQSPIPIPTSSSSEQQSNSKNEETAPYQKKEKNKKKESRTPTPTPPSLDKNKKTKQNLQYPIKELGNCKNEADCKKYCDLKENTTKCVEYGKKSGLMTAQEAEAAESVANTTNGPTGCTNQESCARVCDDSANMDACLDYAQKNKLMTADELEKAKKVTSIISSGTKTPGDCKTPQACRQYCTGGTHVDECVEFARGAGLLSEEEAKEIEEGRDFLKNGGPGGCKTR